MKTNLCLCLHKEEILHCKHNHRNSCQLQQSPNFQTSCNQKSLCCRKTKTDTNNNNKNTACISDKWLHSYRVIPLFSLLNLNLFPIKFSQQRSGHTEVLSCGMLKIGCTPKSGCMVPVCAIQAQSVA